MDHANYYAGRVAAGTLGYIGGNLQGAYVADKIFTKLYMPAIDRNPGRLTAAQRQRASRQRVQNVNRGRYVRVRRVPHVRKLASNARPNGYAELKKRKSKKSVSRRKSSIPGKAPTKRFRDMVKKSMKSKDPRGIMTEINCQNFNKAALGDNLQEHFYPGNIGPGGIFFTPEHFVDAASVLWNSKPMALVKPIGGAGNFPFKTLRFRINNSYVTTEFKNNSQSTYYLTLTTLRPKSVDSFAGSDPLNFWSDILVQDGAGVPVGNGANVSGVLKEFLGVSPNFLPGFKKFFEMDTEKFVLQPGQTTMYFCQGPKDFDFELAKMYNGDDFITAQKFSRWCFATVYTDLVSDTAGIGGRLLNVVAGAGANLGLVLENRYHYDLAMPEQAGFVTPAAFTGLVSTPLSQRGFKYAFQNYTPPSAGGAVQVERVDDDQPANIEAV